MLVGVLLFSLMVATALPAWRGERPAAALLALEGVTWLFADKWFDGPHLYSVRHGHALVLADLVGLAALLGAAACSFRDPRAGPDALSPGALSPGAAGLMRAASPLPVQDDESVGR